MTATLKPFLLNGAFSAMILRAKPAFVELIIVSALSKGRHQARYYIPEHESVYLLPDFESSQYEATVEWITENKAILLEKELNKINVLPSEVPNLLFFDEYFNIEYRDYVDHNLVLKAYESP